MNDPTPRWSLTTCRTDDRPGPVAAVARADGTFAVPDALAGYDGLLQAMEDWPAVAAALATTDVAALPPLSSAVALAPLRYPRKVVCAGANYRDHLREMGGPEDLASFKPFFFSVPPTTTVIGDGEPIQIPADPSYAVDWEAELAIVIGIGGRDIAPAEALSHVAGYACFSDITARGMLRRADAFAEPFRWDWAGSKSLDTFCPLGPITPAWLVPDPGHLAIRCLINGVVKQDSSTSQLIADIPTIISAASQTWTLEPGDVIATGTPAGVGAPRGERLGDGDQVRVEIEGLSPLTNPVVVRRSAHDLALAASKEGTDLP